MLAVVLLGGCSNLQDFNLSESLPKFDLNNALPKIDVNQLFVYKAPEKKKVQELNLTSFINIINMLIYFNVSKRRYM